MIIHWTQKRDHNKLAVVYNLRIAAMKKIEKIQIHILQPLSFLLIKPFFYVQSSAMSIEVITQISSITPKKDALLFSPLADKQDPNQIQPISDNNKAQTTSVNLDKVIKKPPPLLIDIQQQDNNESIKRSVALKSPSTSIRLMDLGDLDNDEQVALEEEIKARRLARRTKTYADDEDEDTMSHITIGTKVAEGHRNYPLMYDMLTGIRIAVGRVSAKIQRPLTPEDFTAAHKLVFDM